MVQLSHCANTTPKLSPVRLLITALNLQAAKRVFVENCNPSRAQLSPMSDDGELDRTNFKIVTLP